MNRYGSWLAWLLLAIIVMPFVWASYIKNRIKTFLQELRGH